MIGHAPAWGCPGEADVKVVVNGQSRECGDGCTVETLLNELGADPRRVAVLVNDEVVSRARWGTRLGDADRVEVVTAAPGG